MNHGATTPWDEYPTTYRQHHVQRIFQAVRAGESAAVVGLSGAGKSNLLGFMANRAAQDFSNHRFVLVDCNRLNPGSTNPADFASVNQAFYRLCLRALSAQPASTNIDAFEAMEVAIGQVLGGTEKLTLLIDRFDRVLAPHTPDPSTQPNLPNTPVDLFNNLRALRDAFKFKLTYVISTRHALSDASELAELFHAHTVWLGALSPSDAEWNVQRYAKRIGVAWGDEVAQKLIKFSGAYPALLRASCEAYATGTTLSQAALNDSEAVRARVHEFWADQPAEAEIEKSGLTSNPMLFAGRPIQQAPVVINTSNLTAKEHALLQYLQAHPNEVCEKDEIIRAVWSEDQVFMRGVRDDSLAQVVRRLREKIETNPSEPQLILTVPGRGYRFVRAESGKL